MLDISLDLGNTTTDMRFLVSRLSARDLCVDIATLPSNSLIIPLLEILCHHKGPRVGICF